MNHDDILFVIENSLFAYPPIPQKLEILNIPGIQGRRALEVAHPLGNLIGAARLDKTNADRVIQQVCDLFMPKHESFGWFVDISTTPDDLGDRLNRAGVPDVGEVAGMVLYDLDVSIDVNPAVTVRRSTDADREVVMQIYVEGYPVPPKMAEIVLDATRLVEGENYLAFIEGEEAPVAVATMTYWSDQPIAVMGGAATLDDYRGRGIYTALMAARLADAHQAGMQAAVMQADRNTSAPICAKLGFEDICPMNFHIWSPEGGH